jgi:proteasome lid subunit RPN8/RPN11
MSFFKNKKKGNKPIIQWKIKQDCLDLIMECAKSNYPNEFGGLLRVDSKSKDTIIEIIILPGTVFGESHAIFQMHMRPLDFSIVGTVHSHPSPSFNPSSADLALFQKYGRIHIIVGAPFDNFSWRAYAQDGTEIEIEIVQ